MSAPIDVSDRPAGSVKEEGRFLLGLTGPGSHVLTTEPGRGNLIVGPPAMGRKADLHVAPDDAIRWQALDPFATPAGSPWPRHLDYHGNDSGFFDWSERRPIEQLSWTPAFADVRSIDAGRARIRTLRLVLKDMAGRLGITLPAGLELSLAGDLARVRVDAGLPGTLSLHPALGRRPSAPAYALPELGLLHEARSLSLYGHPLGQAISLGHLDRFTALERLALWGGFSDWGALARLPRLRTLEIRYCADLAGLPALDAWPMLERLIAFNVDEAAGLGLKVQVEARGKVRAWDDYTSVSQLRKPDWWPREYGRPFGAWDSRAAKAANAAYDTALETLRQARSADEARAAIVAFARRFNGMQGIETSQREDIGEAVWQFSRLDRVAGLGVTEAQALQWFDEARDY